MKHLFILPIFFTFTLIDISCKKKEIVKISEFDNQEVLLSKFAVTYPEFDFQKFRTILNLHIQEDSVLNYFFPENSFNPLWMHDTLNVSGLRELASILDQASSHGLSRDIFDYDKIISLTNIIDSGSDDNTDSIYYKIAELEKISTKSILKYATGMSYGFLNPKDLYKSNYAIKIASPDSIFYVDLMNKIKEDPISTLKNSEPKDYTYQQLKNEYKLLDSLKDIPFNKSDIISLKLGDKNKSVSAIANRLSITGEFIKDTLLTDTLLLDEKLLAGINSFRKKNSFPEETDVDKATIELLNRPISHYANKVRANMERLRWKKTTNKYNKHIDVNVASAMLVATSPDTLPLIMKVCVGSVANKTPSLESEISYINLNPTWGVPNSIAKNEVFVKQKKDPTYMHRNNMRIYQGGKEVDLSSVDWANSNPQNLSYSIRQNSGPGNSLGLIKFMFNNPFSVYLHDTPSKKAFDRKNRAVSHGCVRLHQPFELAYFCATPVPETYKDQLYYSVGKSPVSEEGKKLLKESQLKKIPNIINIDPENKISLYIDYYTAFTYPNNDQVYYAEDRYSYDPIILEHLDSLK